MSITSFNITKSIDALGSKSQKEQMKAKQEHHVQKKHNVLKIILEQSDFFCQDADNFSNQTELLGHFFDPILAHFGEGVGFDLT